MDLAAIDLNLLVAFDLLLERRSVRAAARAAHVTPSAMSHTLGRLRALFDDELLVRAGAEMVPTARAEALVGPVRDALAAVRVALTPPERFDPTTLRRAFRIVATDHVSTVLLPRVAALLRAEAPGVDLHERPLVPGVMDELRRGEADVAIGIFPEATPEMRARRLFSDGFVTVARVDHPRLRGPALTLDDFLVEGHLLVAPRGTPSGLIDAVLAERGLQRRVVRTVPHFLAALWQVQDDDLLLTVSRRLVAVVAGRLPLRVFATPLSVPDYHLSALWHPRTESAPDDAWLRSVLVRAAAGLDEVRVEEAPEGPSQTRS